MILCPASNQDEGGVLLFVVDEKRDFAELGVYDAQDLMKHVVEQCNQMSPVVRPVFTTLLQGNRVFVSAEIPGIDVTNRPCYYAGKGRLKGSYVRVGDADEPMTEYEIYSYEAFRRKYQDDVRASVQTRSGGSSVTLTEGVDIVQLGHVESTALYERNPLSRLISFSE